MKMQNSYHLQHEKQKYTLYLYNIYKYGTVFIMQFNVLYYASVQKFGVGKIKKKSLIWSTMQ